MVNRNPFQVGRALRGAVEKPWCIGALAFGPFLIVRRPGDPTGSSTASDRGFKGPEGIGIPCEISNILIPKTPLAGQKPFEGSNPSLPLPLSLSANSKTDDSSGPNNQDADAPFNRRNSESSTMLLATRS